MNTIPMVRDRDGKLADVHPDEVKNMDGWSLLKSPLVEEDETDGPEGTALTVGKGPGGKWFVKIGKERVAGPFQSEEEAIQEKDKLTATDPQDTIQMSA